MFSAVRRHRVNFAGLPLILYALVSCIAAAGFMFWLHLLLQPTRIGNPGVAAYKAPPATIVKVVSPARIPPAELARAEFVEPIVVETPSAAAPKPAAEPKKAAEVKPRRPKRQQVARKPQRTPRNDFAYQPYFGGGFWR